MLDCATKVLVPYRIAPTYVRFQRIPRNAGPQTQTVKLTRGDGGPLAPTLLPLHNKNVETALREIEPGESYELDITVKPPWPNQLMRVALPLETGVPESPRGTIQVSAQIMPQLAAQPGRLTIRTPQDTPQEYRIALKWASESHGRVTEASSRDKRIKVQVEERDGRQELLVTVPAGYMRPAPRQSATITVKTDDRWAPRLDIPVYVTQAAPRRSLTPARGNNPALRSQPTAQQRPGLTPAPQQPTAEPVVKPKPEKDGG